MALEESNLSFLFTPKYKENTVTVGSMDIHYVASEASSTDFDETGQILWRVSKLFVLFLQKNPQLVRNRNILELGSGTTAFGGIASLQLGAKAAICTDYQPHIVDICKQSLLLNKFHGLINNSLQVGLLSDTLGKGSSYCHKWGDKESLMEILREEIDHEKIQLVVGCDVCVWEDSLPGLFSTAVEALSYNTSAAEERKSHSLKQTHPQLVHSSGILHPSLYQHPLIIFAFERRALRPEKKMEAIAGSYGLERLRISAPEFVEPEILEQYPLAEFFIDIYYLPSAEPISTDEPNEAAESSTSSSHES
ncbi:putative methyltransferase-like protein 23 [Monocercomonoides exilis]|uniref:putative methyltransferase-like protein 23 n=1 Tax=Monocercomonoides exilis TaxID=2049356 RepID=UPI00355AC8C5|nr:putative methyltransferase-like protein 23 [Monocercomonoides exilis]|eukprot:MONOS_13441.1-p1 / transcript=MONOS_13441.1 / gene=MONOS_13441 / organism=Monocercomonoides_exilis_PA203 / gene_product=unspecified product / transcript_product=unspecified product / location=Mono_scaffold00829:21975-23406(-) / protein_length=306 / sequence_SO=supercontig / SO=protein_coding / is_pseudo=false